MPRVTLVASEICSILTKRFAASFNDGDIASANVQAISNARANVKLAREFLF
jgi:hypothetical protein